MLLTNITAPVLVVSDKKICSCFFYIKVRRQSSTTPDPGHRMGKWPNTRKHHIQESQEVSPFPAGEQTRKQVKHETWTTKMIYKRSTAMELSVRTILLEGLNMFYGTSFICFTSMCKPQGFYKPMLFTNPCKTYKPHDRAIYRPRGIIKKNLPEFH